MGLLGDWGYRKLLRHQLDAAEQHFAESLEIARDVGHTVSICVRLADLGDVARRRGAYDAAERYFNEAITLGNKHTLISWLPIVHLRYARLKAAQHDHTTAADHLTLAQQNKPLLHIEYDKEWAQLLSELTENN